MSAPKPTPAEAKFLELVLREVRHVMSTKEQLAIHVDPYVDGSGLDVCFAYNGEGWQTPIDGVVRKQRKRTRRAGR